MSLICTKYFDKQGWVVAKNCDTIHKPHIRIRKSFRRNIERLYIWDEDTKYTEGINQWGVAVSLISSNILQERGLSKSETLRTGRYYSPTGLRLRKALFEKDAQKALKSLISQEILGNIIVADPNRCFFVISTSVNNKYSFHYQEIKRDEIKVIGVSDRNNDEEWARCEFVREHLANVKDLEEFLELLSFRGVGVDNNINICRIANVGELRTSGQLVLVPDDKTLHYRSIWGKLSFDLETLNRFTEKTFFEVVSTRKLINFKEHFTYRRY